MSTQQPKLDPLSQKQLEMINRQEKYKAEMMAKKQQQEENDGTTTTKKRKSKKKDEKTDGKKKKKSKTNNTQDVQDGTNAMFYSMGAYVDDTESAPSSPSSSAPNGDGSTVDGEVSTEKEERRRGKKEHLLGLITFKIIEFLQEDTSKKYSFNQILESIDYNSCTEEVDEEDEKKTKTVVRYEDSLAAHLDDKTKRAIFTKLKDNQKVDYTPGPLKTKGIDDAAVFSFKAIHQSVKNKEDILNLLKHPEFVISGIPVSELAESYKTVGEDVEQLKKAKLVIAIPNQDKKCEILYYNDPTVAMPSIDPKLKQLWADTRSRKISNNDLKSLLEKAGLPPIQTVEWPEDEYRRKKEAEREEMAKNTKIKRSRKMNINKMTNKHLKDAFVADQQQTTNK
ncbi:hypothetical protein FDP41_005035 [Naegleria fowleri]|uniref:TFA2 Winged helix domain-containing protein n=1 Tax=Naegleria fowleri TaxID=5763 RepID=A0A6A5BNH7_NAEFO|nr:uncharacterized protein FDP41_005035 [Naegleria fowleri]KAF0975708.1 hypothetical protein FDP41_005035 [Naegleria fowleri]CAG4717475.1 unnamed protein product [Naegleria fowleri]